MFGHTSSPRATTPLSKAFGCTCTITFETHWKEALDTPSRHIEMPHKWVFSPPPHTTNHTCLNLLLPNICTCLVHSCQCLFELCFGELVASIIGLPTHDPFSTQPSANISLQYIGFTSLWGWIPKTAIQPKTKKIHKYMFMLNEPPTHSLSTFKKYETNPATKPPWNLSKLGWLFLLLYGVTYGPYREHISLH